MEEKAIRTSSGLQIIPKSNKQKRIESHKNAASHFEAAAKSHRKAARLYEHEKDERAAKSMTEAHVHAKLAIEAQREDVQQSATNA